MLDMSESGLPVTVRRKGLAAFLLPFLRPGDAGSAELHGADVVLTSVFNVLTVPYGRIEAVETGKGRFWHAVRVETARKNKTVSGLSQIQAETLAGGLETAVIDWWRMYLKEHREILESALGGFDGFSNLSEYMRHSAFLDLKESAGRVARELPKKIPRQLPETDDIRRVKAVLSFLHDPDAFRKWGNEAFVNRELERSKDFFDNVAAHPLTPAQRRAVIIDEDRNLVVAAAGSGKTSVIAAKAAWLVQRRRRSPSDLLLLAFAKDAQKEMEQRLHDCLGGAAASKINVRTFHSLGMSVIGQAEGRVPSLAKTAEDERKFAEFLQEIVTGLLKSPGFWKVMSVWFQNHFARYRSATEFRTFGEYIRYIRTNEIRSLKGDKVKSFEECEIANFLYLNGVSYEYEGDYEYEIVTSEKRQYKPDFRLTEAGIYIEHWGISKSGKTAPYVNQTEYRVKMKWARKIHKKYGTALVETYSYEKQAGELTQNLEKKLTGLGVEFAPRPAGNIFQVLAEQGRITSFIRLLVVFLRQFKRARMSIEEVSERAAVSAENMRATAFLSVFGPVYEEYQKRLSDSRTIDFEDMIIRATEHVEIGRYTRSHGYILVDEFQDLSPDRERLLRALLNKSPDNQLFAVGDDWQSIYRFAGSDPAVMRRFSDRFGVNERTDLGETFRCADKIADAAAKFVLGNPDQLQKKVSSENRAGGPCISIGVSETGGRDLLPEALKKIESMRKPDARASVLILGRYSRLKPLNLPRLAERHPGLALSYKTVHKSKGLEADYVVVLGLCSGEKYSFPSEMDSDPLLDLVLGAPEKHPNAEERRLFYVAMTRARRHVFLLADGGAPSVFVQELLGGDYEVNVFGRDPEKDIPCPECVEGRLVRREKDGIFYGCSNYPHCEYTQSACLHCSEGLPVKSEKGFLCRDCGEAAKMCPKCGGRLRTRRRKKDGGLFVGCSNWPGCNHIENMPEKTPPPGPGQPPAARP